MGVVRYGKEVPGEVRYGKARWGWVRYGEDPTIFLSVLPNNFA